MSDPRLHSVSTGLPPSEVRPGTPTLLPETRFCTPKVVGGVSKDRHPGTPVTRRERPGVQGLNVFLCHPIDSKEEGRVYEYPGRKVRPPTGDATLILEFGFFNPVRSRFLQESYPLIRLQCTGGRGRVVVTRGTSGRSEVVVGREGGRVDDG